MVDYRDVLDRVGDAASLADGGDRVDAERVVALCRQLAQRERREGQLSPEPDDAGLKRELGRLSETLGRRGSHALPAAALGRAALADLAGDGRAWERALSDCNLKLQMFGL